MNKTTELSLIAARIDGLAQALAEEQALLVELVAEPAPKPPKHDYPIPPEEVRRKPKEEPDAFGRAHKIKPILIGEDPVLKAHKEPEVKFCKDCEHYHSSTFMHCTLHEAKLFSLVDGCVVDECGSARHGGPCGEEGKYWEAKKV